MNLLFSRSKIQSEVYVQKYNIYIRSRPRGQQQICICTIPYSWKIWQFGGLYYNRQIKIRKNFLLAYIHMAIPYRTTKFKSANILGIAILGSTAKLNSRQYFWLYSINRLWIWRLLLISKLTSTEYCQDLGLYCGYRIVWATIDSQDLVASLKLDHNAALVPGLPYSGELSKKKTSADR